jgi:hypothetical protein
MNVIYFILQVILYGLILVVLIGFIPYSIHFVVKFSIGKDKRKMVKWKQRRERILKIFGLERVRKTKINYESLREEANRTYRELRNMPPADEEIVSEFIFNQFDKIATYYFQKGKKSAREGVDYV